MTTPTPAELLRSAADRIEADGLNKKGYFAGYDVLTSPHPAALAKDLLADDVHVAVDPLGALYLTGAGYEDIDKAIGLLAPFFGHTELNMDLAFDIIDWTDAEERTSEEVVARLREAADTAA